jgi:hypothetical protein
MFTISLIVWLSPVRPSWADHVNTKHLYVIPRQIQYSFTFRNITSQKIETVKFQTFACVKQTAMQWCDQVRASEPCKQTVDEIGNQMLTFSVSKLAPYATKVISIQNDLYLSNKPVSIKLKDKYAYLKNEPYMEVDHKAIKKAAHKLIGPNADATAKNIFQWVADHVQYIGYISQERGALYALEKKKGDCTEYMYLFAALCRASGIPTRCVGGYVCRRNTILNPENFHNWAEFYDQGTWHVADPQRQVFHDLKGEYIAMKIFGYKNSGSQGAVFHRFRIEGQGIQIQMNSSVSLNRDFQQSRSSHQDKFML